MDAYTILKDWWGLIGLPLVGLLVGGYRKLMARLGAAENRVGMTEAGLAELRQAHNLAIQTLREQRAEDAARSKESRDRVEHELTQMSATMRENFNTLLAEIRSLRGGR